MYRIPCKSLVGNLNSFLSQRGTVATIFAKENGQGMGFDVYQDEDKTVGSRDGASDVDTLPSSNNRPKSIRQ